MMKYRGPTDQHRWVERRYIVRLFAGLFVTSIGIAVSRLGFAVKGSDVQYIGIPEDGGSVDRTVALIAMFAGLLLNIYGIYKYRSEYGEIREKEPRPEGLFTVAGLLITLAVLGAGLFMIFNVPR
jgi:uncharacterized membrane protein YidH (DUF202 family)